MPQNLSILPKFTNLAVDLGLGDFQLKAVSHSERDPGNHN